MTRFEQFGRNVRYLAALVGVAVLQTGGLPAAAQTVDEVKNAFEIMVNSASACSDYLGKPEVLADMRATGHGKLTEAGMSAGDADAFLDNVVADAKAETLNETQKQVACEIVNIPAIK